MLRPPRLKYFWGVIALSVLWLPLMIAILYGTIRLSFQVRKVRKEDES
jgi:hypothetical protein